MHLDRIPPVLETPVWQMNFFTLRQPTKKQKTKQKTSLERGHVKWLSEQRGLLHKPDDLFQSLEPITELSSLTSTLVLWHLWPPGPLSCVYAHANIHTITEFLKRQREGEQSVGDHITPPPFSETDVSPSEWHTALWRTQESAPSCCRAGSLMRPSLENPAF